MKAVLPLLFALSVLLGPAAAQSSSPSEFAIYGGQRSAECAWASVVSMEGDCTGTLVDGDIVLYAAHCGTEFRRVDFGDSDLYPVYTAVVDYCKAMPKARPGDGNDLAFCKLTTIAPVPFTPIANLGGYENFSEGDAATIVGFGVDENFESGSKREVNVQLEAVSPTGELFMGGSGKDSCIGDSGGPAMTLGIAPSNEGEYRVMAVASHGRGCGDGGYYASAFQARDWIERETGRPLAGDSLGYDKDEISQEWAQRCGSNEQVSGCGIGGARTGWRGSLLLLLVVCVFARTRMTANNS